MKNNDWVICILCEKIRLFANCYHRDTSTDSLKMNSDLYLRLKRTYFKSDFTIFSLEQNRYYNLALRWADTARVLLFAAASEAKYLREKCGGGHHM